MESVKPPRFKLGVILTQGEEKKLVEANDKLNAMIERRTRLAGPNLRAELKEARSKMIEDPCCPKNNQRYSEALALDPNDLPRAIQVAAVRSGIPGTMYKIYLTEVVPVVLEVYGRAINRLMEEIEKAKSIEQEWREGQASILSFYNMAPDPSPGPIVRSLSSWAMGIKSQIKKVEDSKSSHTQRIPPRIRELLSPVGIEFPL